MLYFTSCVEQCTGGSTQVMGGPSRDQQLSIFQLLERYPDEDSARKFFEDSIWPEGKRCCSHCGSTRTYRVSHPTMPYRCGERECGKYFSCRTGTPMQASNLSLRTWLLAVFLELEHPKGISSCQLAKLLGVTQATAWHTGHRIRAALAQEGGRGERFDGPVEVDETFVGGKLKHMTKERREQYRGRGTVSKVPVCGLFDRATGRVSAEVVPNTSKATLQRFVFSRVKAGTTVVFTDELASYHGLPRHHAVTHSAGEYVRASDDGLVHTNSVESFWSTFKRSYKGVYHLWTPKHLSRYVAEFTGRFNLKNLGTQARMEQLARLMAGARLRYVDLVET